MVVLSISPKTTCEDPEVEIEVTRQYSRDPQDETMKIYRGSRTTGTMILELRGESAEWGDQKVLNICVQPTLHTLVRISSSGNGWTAGSYVLIKRKNTILSKYGLSYGTYAESVFYPYYLVTNESSWRYISIPIPYKEWTAYSYDDSNWNYYYTGTFPKPNSITRYYRRKVSLDDNIKGISLFELTVKSKEGILIYINSKLLYIHNVLNSSISPTDYAIQSDSDYILNTYSGNFDYYVGNTTGLVIAIEIHKIKNSTEINDLFEAYLMFLAGDMIQRNINGIATSTTLYNEKDIPENAFDGFNYTKWSGLYINNQSSLLYHFTNNRKEWINSIEITVDPLDSLSSPSSFIVSGTNNNGTTWEKIAFYNNILYNNITYMSRFNIPSNIHLFETINITFINSIDININPYVSIVNLNLYASNNVIIEEYSYGSDSFTWFINIETVYIIPIHSGVSEYVLKYPRNMPKGLYLDSMTGIIKGNPQVEYNDMFIIEGYSYKDEIYINMQFHVNIIECNNNQYIILEFIKVSNEKAEEYERYELIDNNHTIIYQDHAIDSLYYKKTICIPKDIYTLRLYSIGASSWSFGSYLLVNMKDDIHINTIFYGSLHIGYSTETSINMNRLLNNRDSNVLCKLDTSQPIESNWYKNNYLSSNPQNTWFPCLNTTKRDSYYTYNRFYRTFLNIDNTTLYQGIEIQLNGPNAIMIYVNERIVYRTDIDELLFSINDSTIPLNNDTTITYRTISLSLTYFHNGNNTIAIALLYSRLIPLPFIENIEISIEALISSATFPRIWNTYGTLLANTSIDVSTLFDSNYDSGYSFDFDDFPDSTIDIVIYYESPYQFEFVNHYCIIVDSETRTMDPSNWVLLGCEYGAEYCASLDARDNVIWTETINKKCFDTTFHIPSYSTYVLRIERTYPSTQKSIFLSQVEFYIINYDSIPVSSLYYYHPTIIGYKGITFPSSFPCEHFYNFEVISGTLPEGIYIDALYGYLYGIPTITVSNLTIVIQAVSIHSKLFMTTIEISIYDCILPNILFYLNFYPSLKTSTNTTYFIVEDLTTHTIIDYHYYLPDYGVSSFVYCRSNGDYSITMNDIDGYGWDNAYISISLRDNTQVFKDRLYPSEQSRTEKFSVYIVYLYSEIEWTYYYDILSSPTISSDWMNPDYEPIGWSYGTRDDMTSPTGITQYYRMNYYFSTLQNIAIISFTLTLRGGCIVYINSKEIYRYGLLEGIITRDTISIFDPYFPETIGGSIHIQLSNIPFFIGNNNTIAIEIHRGQHIYTDPIFNVSITPFIHNLRYHLNGYGDSSPYIPENTKYTIDYAFDSLKETVYHYPSKCQGISIRWIFLNQRKEFINQYSISTSNFCNLYTPSGWILEASNDNGKTFDILHKTNNQIFTYFYEEKVYQFLSDKPYNMFQLTINECENTYFLHDTPSLCTDTIAIQISEFTLYTGLLYTYCPTNNGYPSVFYGEYSYKSCGLFYKGQKSRFCSEQGQWEEEDLSNCTYSSPTFFYYTKTVYLMAIKETISTSIPIIDSLYMNFTIFPSLPSSYTLNPYTGMISGTSNKSMFLTTYTITASSIYYNTIINTTIMISISNSTYSDYCNEDNQWPRTYQGNTTTVDCPSGFTGVYSRTCLIPIDASTKPIWSSISNYCILSSYYITLSYESSEYIFPKNESILIEPLVSGEVIDWIISPNITLPYLAFNKGIFTGLSYVREENIIYTITAIGLYNNASTTISISFYEFVCKKEGIWPYTYHGETVILPCPSGYSGSRSRTCKEIKSVDDVYFGDNQSLYAKWEQELFECTYSSPIISLTPIHIEGIINSELYPITPLCIGICTSWSVIPSLPKGLLFNNTTGIISGIPKIPYKDVYHYLIAYNQDHYSYIPFIITISNPQCPAIDGFPATNKGELVEISCPDMYKEGTIIKLCSNDNIPYWILISSSLLYKDEPLVRISPIIQNYISYWYVVPDFPRGIKINQNGGSIEGTAIELSSLKKYRIIAGNPDKETSIYIQLLVIERICPKENDWPETKVNQTIYLLCPSIKTGYRMRSCVLEGSDTKWTNENDTRCIPSPLSPPDVNTVFIDYTIYISNLTSNIIYGNEIYMLYNGIDSFFYPYLSPYNHIWITSIQDLNIISNVTTITLPTVSISIRIYGYYNDILSLKDPFYLYLTNDYIYSSLQLQLFFKNRLLSSDYQSITIIYHNVICNEFLTVFILLLLIVTLVILFYYLFYMSKCYCTKKINKRKSQESILKERLI
ncbi:hypothetical protein WA158_005580 [Blastocystis sp. Blastoise]